MDICQFFIYVQIITQRRIETAILNPSTEVKSSQNIINIG